MSWLRSTSLNFARQVSRSLDPRHDYEPQACFSSFCKHWQQAHEIILKSQPQHLHDDVLGVVNHLEQLATLLVLEAKAREVHGGSSPSPCLEHLLSQNLLDKLYEWAVCTGKYENAVRLEQLKLFTHLVTHYSTQVIAAEPFLRPLLKLLSDFRNDLLPKNVEAQLVNLLNQLCVALMQNMKFIDLFFLTAHTQNGSHSEFIIVRLLLSSVHREGGVGAAARDALLLCANMSARQEQLAEFMLQGNTCPVLATGLSGLYSLLPRTLPEGAHRLTPDDVNKVHKLTLFYDSLEFCNAVAQVAHPSVRKHLLDLLYQGFLVPVLGPALLQTKGALQSGAGEQAAATAHLELLLRCVTARGLLRAVLHFLFVYQYDGVRVLDVLLRRLDGNSQLSLVSLSLMETLIDLNCEDVMLELVFKFLLNGHHLMVNHRHKIADPEPYRDAAISLLSLSPRCCGRPFDAARCEALPARSRPTTAERSSSSPRGDIAMSRLGTDEINYGNPNDSLFSNYHAYLCDARFEIVSRALAISNWSSKYDALATPKREPNNNTKEKEIENDREAATATKEQDSLISICTSEYDTLKTSDTSEKEPHSLTSLNENIDNSDKNAVLESANSEGKEHDSLISIGDSSDYESYKGKDSDSEGFAEEVFRKSIRKVTNDRGYEEMPQFTSWRASAESIIGPLLSSVLKKAAALLEADLAANCRVTSLVSKMAALPTALLTSLLLCPGFVLQPNVPSLFQILSKLKEEVDELTDEVENSAEFVEKARAFLVRREMALAQRLPNGDGAGNKGPAHAPEPPSQKAEESPFRRVEPKRRSLSSSLSNFARKLSSSPSQPPTSLQPTSPQKRPDFTQESYWNQSITLRSILNAVILDQWLKELAAICEEQALRLSAENYEDDHYVRMVAL